MTTEKIIINIGTNQYHVPTDGQTKIIPITDLTMTDPGINRVGFHDATVVVLAFAKRIQQLESLFTQPTPDMVQAGLAEVQRMLDDWDADGHITLGSCNDPVSDAQASDMAVFVLQAMAGKLPKAGE